MKLGFLSAILEDWSFEEMIDTARDLGFSCVEVACWPSGTGNRRYAGTSHIDAERVLVDDDYANHILEYSKKNGITLSSLGYYPNVLDADKNAAEAAISHLKALIKASSRLGINMVTTFIGRNQSLNVEDNLELVKKVWPPIIRLAEESNVRIGIENCPMLFSKEQWPGGQNLMSNPSNWRRVFEILPSNNLGLNYDPSHFVWQMMDYIKPVYEFKDKIFHIHYKDMKVYKDKLDQVGITAYPLDFMAPKIPGLGDVEWPKFVSALNDIGFNGYSVIEIEDRAFEDSHELIIDSLKLSKKYLGNFIA